MIKARTAYHKVQISKFKARTVYHKVQSLNLKVQSK